MAPRSLPVEPTPEGADASRLLVPGRTCWRIARADDLAVIVDAAAYFAAVKAAILEARHSVLMIGWDFDTRLRLEPDAPRGPIPDRLGRFLNAVIRRRPELRIKVLKWDLGALQAFGRGSTPFFLLDWLTDQRISYRLDAHHPVAAAHHQKIVVIDDALAFCGGIDITAGRWDTRHHRDDDPRRRYPTTRRRYGPWHDATTAVSGPVARALGDLARERWFCATGERLEPAPPRPPLWPAGLEPVLQGAPVGIARTAADHGGHPELREVEALYLAAIRSARRSIYLESQYFASRRIAEAIAARLREPDPPEIVVVNPLSCDGWLEEATMGTARARFLALVRQADHAGRFRIYYPVTEGGQPIYVHAKVTVVDGTFLRVGSSNLNNRSMGFDTECDLAVEAHAGDPEAQRLAAAISCVRDDLLAEHLGVPVAVFQEAVQRHDGSLIGAIEALRGAGRTLRPFDPPEYGAIEEALADHELLDPESRSRLRNALKRRLRRFVPRFLRPAIIG